MTDTKNRFGLTRPIPEDVAKIVRQRCGFGCIICGSAFYDYEHFSPEFKDAQSHDPNGIVLLCPNHHRSKGNFISDSTLEKASKSPISKSTGFSHVQMDIDNLTVEIGPVTAEHCLIPLQVNIPCFSNRFGDKVFGLVPKRFLAVKNLIWFEPAEIKGGPLRLNVELYDSDGAKLAWIDNNVWHGSTQNLDIKIICGRERSKITVKRQDNQVILDLGFFSPQSYQD